MDDAQKVIDILKNINPGVIYYVKVVDTNKLKNGGDEGSVIEGHLLNDKVKEDDINNLLDNYIVIWIEEFKTINNKGRIIYKMDEIKLLETIYKFKFNKDIDVKKTEQSSFNVNTAIEDPYLAKITKELLDFIKNDKKLQNILMVNELDIIGLIENGKFVFKLLNKNMNTLTSIDISMNSNEIIRYMRFSLFVEQIKSIVNKGV